MTTQWARKEAHTNELANVMQDAVAWADRNRPAAFGGVAVLLTAVSLAAIFFTNRHRSSEDSWTQFALAQAYAYAGRPVEALAMAGKLDSEHPGTLAAGYGDLLTADIIFHQGKAKEAGDIYKRVSEATADKALSAMALAGLGQSLEAAGDYKAAAETDQRFLDGHPDHPMAAPTHASLARSLEKLGQVDKARTTFERISFLYPDSYWAAWAKARAKK